MKNDSKFGRRVELGRISKSTRGSVYGTLEEIGLFRPAIQLEDR